jgi:hypothetical protein
LRGTLIKRIEQQLSAGTDNNNNALVQWRIKNAKENRIDFALKRLLIKQQPVYKYRIVQTDANPENYERILQPTQTNNRQEASPVLFLVYNGNQ